MKTIDLKAFRKSINLTQEALGEYLGCKKAFISAIENGNRPIPEEMFAKLLDNPHGWDALLFVKTHDINPIRRDAVAEKTERILALMEEQQKTHRTLMEMISEKDRIIQELTEELRKYREEKKGTASNAGGSSSANVG